MDIETSKTKPIYKLSETITQDGELVVNFAKDSIQFCFVNSSLRVEYGSWGKYNFKSNGYL